MALPARVQEIQDALAGSLPVGSAKLQLTFANVDGRRVTFCTNKRRDPIQKTHRKGNFYEGDELRFLATLVKPGSTIVDIGANVGNHSLYFSLMMGAKRVIPFEPNPLAYEMLIANILVNGMGDVVDFSHLGKGLSDHSEQGFAMEARERNLGAAKMLPGEGDIEIHRADVVLQGETPDFIKIDVEGMEVDVLRGLGDIPSTIKPLIFIEVDHENSEDFDSWCRDNDFQSLHQIRRYRSNLYHLIAHKSRAKALATKIKKLTSEAENA